MPRLFCTVMRTVAVIAALGAANAGMAKPRKIAYASGRIARSSNDCAFTVSVGVDVVVRVGVDVPCFGVAEASPWFFELCVDVAIRVTVALGVALRVGVGVEPVEGVLVALRVGVAIELAVAAGVALRVGMAVEPVVAAAVALRVGLAVKASVWVSVAVRLMVVVGVRDAVTLL